MSSTVAEPAVESGVRCVCPTLPARHPVERAVVLVVTAVLPGALIIYLGVHSGGYPRGVVAAVATLLALLLAIRALLAPATVQLPGRIGLPGAGRAAVLAIWQLLSAEWSDSAWRAIAEFNRTVLYFLVYLTFATLPKRRLKPVIARLASASSCWPARPGVPAAAGPAVGRLEVSPQRLSYPLGYWNAMGVWSPAGWCCACTPAPTAPGRSWSASPERRCFRRSRRRSISRCRAAASAPRSRARALRRARPSARVARRRCRDRRADVPRAHAAYDAPALISPDPTSASRSHRAAT